MKEIEDFNMESDIKFLTREIDVDKVLQMIEEGSEKEEKVEEKSAFEGKRKIKSPLSRNVAKNIDELRQEEKEERIRKSQDFRKSFGKKFAYNVMLLVIAQILVKVLGLVYKIVIVNIPGFGDVGNGYYSAGYEIYALLLAFSSIGIPSVIAKLVSERVAVGDNKGAQRIFKVSFGIFVGIGAVSSAGLYIFADWIAANILNVPDVGLVLKVLAPAIVFVSASAVIRGYFSGIDDMKVTSISQMLEQLLNAVLSIALVYAVIGKDPYIMAAAGNVATTISVILAFIYVAIYYKKKKLFITKNEVSLEEKKSTKELIKTILSFSIPVTLASIVSVMNTIVDTITTTNYIQKAFESQITDVAMLQQKAVELKGMLSKVNTIIGLPQSITIAVAIAIVPIISAYIAKGDKKGAKDKLSRAITLSNLIIMPATIGLVVLAEPILKVLYPNASQGGLLLTLISIPSIFICLSLVLNSGLQGIGKVIPPTIAVIVSVILKILFNSILMPIPSINIYGAAISSTISQFVAIVISYVAIRRYMDFSMEWIKTFKIFISASIMGTIVYVAHGLLVTYLREVYATIYSVLVGIAVYPVTLFAIKAIDIEDIKQIPGGKKGLNLWAKIVKKVSKKKI